jgi:hypothetical protein
MKIFLDTNVFYNDWFLRNANFKYLFHFLNNEWHTLLLSELVLEESGNIRNREIGEALSEIKKSIKKIQKLNKTKINYEQSSIGIAEYHLLPLIEERVENTERISYDNIPHSEVVQRALLNKKPFLDGEKGYRDTLIWLSLIDYLVTNNIEDDVAFITGNKSDFFTTSKKSKCKFSKDLEDDIASKGVKAKIIPYVSLYDFVNSTIDKDDHAIDHYKSEEVFEDFIESSAQYYLEDLSNENLATYLGDSIFESKVKDILEIRAEIFEGLEDLEVLNTKEIGENEVYVSYSYNLRTVILEIDIPKTDYITNKQELDKIFDESEISDDIATGKIFMRPYFNVSFIYNDRHEDLRNYEVADLCLRR